MTVAPPIRVTVANRIVEVDVADAVDESAVRAVLRAFPPAAPDQPAALRCTIARAIDGVWQIGDGSIVTHRAVTLEHALLALEWRIVSDLLARRTDRFHLHGAALADPSGAISVLVLGESGVGKTTLTLALTALGFRPFADDVVLLDPDTLQPERFPRAFHVDATTRNLVSPLFGQHAWEEDGLPDGYCLPRDWATVPLPVGAILLPKGYGHELPLLIAQSMADAALALLTHTSTLEVAPRLALRAAARVAAAAPAYAVWSGDLATTADVVKATVAGLVNRRMAVAPPREP